MRDAPTALSTLLRGCWCQRRGSTEVGGSLSANTVRGACKGEKDDKSTQRSWTYTGFQVGLNERD